jgi:hypothetical protein
VIRFGIADCGFISHDATPEIGVEKRLKMMEEEKGL